MQVPFLPHLLRDEPQRSPPLSQAPLSQPQSPRYTDMAPRCGGHRSGALVLGDLSPAHGSRAEGPPADSDKLILTIGLCSCCFVGRRHSRVLRWSLMWTLVRRAPWRQRELTAAAFSPSPRQPPGHPAFFTCFVNVPKASHHVSHLHRDSSTASGLLILLCTHHHHHLLNVSSSKRNLCPH